MKKHVKKSIILLAIVILCLYGIGTILQYFSPQEIVDTIGIENGIVLAFFVSFFGGFSSGGSVLFIGVLAILVAGGINPIILGLVCGSALAIGDLILFFLGNKGRDVLEGKWDVYLNRAEQKVKNNTWLKKLLPFFAYVYIGFAPLPNDVLIAFLASIRYSVKKTIIIFILGDLTFALFISLISFYSLI